jgi:hydrogenase expression/formation protein HypC
MCLAVPAQVVEKTGDDAVVDLQGNRLRISTALTPEVGIGDWVLVHAGFSITHLSEADARETWDYLRQALGDALTEAGGEPAGGEPALLPPNRPQDETGR